VAHDCFNGIGVLKIQRQERDERVVFNLQTAYLQTLKHGR
jgi:hypothetical protein